MTQKTKFKGAAAKIYIWPFNVPAAFQCVEMHQQ